MTVCSILQQLTAYIHLGMRLQHCGIDSLRTYDITNREIKFKVRQISFEQI